MDDRSQAYCFLPVIVPILLFFVGRYLRIDNRVNNDLKAMKVESRRGKALVTVQRQNYGYSQQIQIDDVKFWTSREVALRFRHLDQYIIYFAPNSKVIVSAEPIVPTS